MNGKLKVIFRLSDEYRKARLIEHGEKIDQKQTVEFDLTEAAPEHRTLIVEYTGVDLRDVDIVRWSNMTWSDHKVTSDPIFLDAVPSLPDVTAHCYRMLAEKEAAQAVYDQHMLDKVLVDMSEKMDLIRQCLANRTLSRVDLSAYLEADRKRLDVDTSKYDALRDEYDEFAVERNAEIAREKEEGDRKKEQAKVQKEALKNAWVQEHGSDHLKRACAAGHDCSRMYWRERAVLEYPGFVVDIEDAAAWKSRSCPSLQALDLRDEILSARPGVEVKIVWLTTAAEDRKDHDDREDFEFEPCEAVAVNDPLYGDWLVKEL